MILPCPLCQARFNVPDDKVSGPGTKIQCPKCKFTFVIKAPGESATAVVKEETKTDTDPAIDPALARAVVAEAIQQNSQSASSESDSQASGGEAASTTALGASAQDTHSTVRIRPPVDTIETKAVETAQVAEPADSGPTKPTNKAPSMHQSELPQDDATEMAGDGQEGDEDDATPTEVDIDPALAKKVREEALANAPDAVAELVLEEVEPEAHALSPDELAEIPDAEIVDADDLAQLAETAGETEVKESLSPRVEAEAAGQWPSIIVDDPLLENNAPSRSDSAKALSAPSGTQGGGAIDAPETDRPDSSGSSQALQAAQHRAQAAQKAVSQLMNSQNVAQAQHQLAAAQAELQRAMVQLQEAQQAYLAAQQRLTATTGSNGAGLSGANAVHSAPVQASPAAGTNDPSADDLSADALELGMSQGHRGMVVYVVAAVALIAAVGAFFLFRPSSKDEPQVEAVQNSADSKTWKGLTVDIQSVQVLPRPSSPSLVVVNAILRNNTSEYRYENPYISGILTSGGAKIDEGTSPCGAKLQSSLILRLVKAKGRQGYYDRLRKFVLASDETQKVKPGGSLPCQILFFDSTGHRSSDGLKVDLQVDKEKTIAAPAK